MKNSPLIIALDVESAIEARVLGQALDCCYDARLGLAALHTFQLGLQRRHPLFFYRREAARENGFGHGGRGHTHVERIG